METLSTPADESARLEAVQRYDILDTPREAGFDRLVELAAAFFSVPVALISIVDHDRVWFKSQLGLHVGQVPREPGLCSSAILRDASTIIGDARMDAQARTNSLVAGSFGLRFYAAAPLRTADGFKLGTLCIMDKEPRVCSAEDVHTLEAMAAVVMDQLELRLHARRTVEGEAALRSSMERVVAERTAQLVQLSRALIKTHEDERRKLAGELHDDMGGALTLLSLKLQELGREIGDGSARQATLQKEAMGILREMIVSQRRIVESLRPLALDMFGLATAVRNHASDWSKKSGVAAKVQVAPDFPTLDAEPALAVFRVVQEALSNVAKYAHASRVQIELSRDSQRITVSIEDDGVGIAESALTRASSHGIAGMRQRLAAFGGDMKVEQRVEHGCSGRGTRIVGSLPFARAPSDAGTDIAGDPSGAAPRG